LRLAGVYCEEKCA